MAALETLQQLQAQQREATSEERAVLARWSGWGAAGLAEVFDESREEYYPDREELRQLLSAREYDAARRTTLNAHYTDPEIARTMWAMMAQLRVSAGNVLEPGSGAGVFIGTAPEGVRMTGVEVDPTTAAISQAIYPQAEIRAESFADTKVRDGVFDAVVGNVPFSRTVLHDPVHNPGRFSMHNHFIVKSLDLLRPGGVMGVITSSYTMDAWGSAAREAMAERADLIGAVRLPNGAFQRSAGTDALTDVLFFRRREEGRAPADPSWVNVAEFSEDVPVNTYWVDHPQRVLGEMRIGSGPFGDRLEVAGDLDTVAPQLETRLLQIAGDAQSRDLVASEPVAAPAERIVTPDLADAPYGTIVETGEAQFGTVTTGGDIAPLRVSATNVAEMRQALALRDMAREVLSIEASTTEDSPELAELRGRLRSTWEQYVERWGPLNRFSEVRTGRVDEQGEDVTRRSYPQVSRLLRTDPFGALTKALENFNEGTQHASPAGLLTHRIIESRPVPTRAETAEDALALCMEQRGYVDLDRVGELLGTDAQNARDRLGESIFELPTGGYEPRSGYLSGNVRVKLEEAQAAVDAGDARFAPNVEALQQVLPEPLTAGDIEAKLGAVWIPAETFTQFAQETFHDSTAEVRHITGSEWAVEGNKRSLEATNTWGTDRMSAVTIMENLMTQASIQVTDPHPDPESNARVPNLEATAAAQEKAEQMAERFSAWVWEDPQRAEELVERYNRTFNSLVLRDYSDEGANLRLPGLVKDFAPRSHQRAAVARMISEPAVGLFHEVGAGKTAEMAIGAMELKRLGMISKPAVVVPNHMLDQFSREWLQLYPQAQLLAADVNDLRGDKRREFVARVATNNWDAVVMTRTAFERLQLSPQHQSTFLEQELTRLRADLERVRMEEITSGSGRASTTVKQMEAKVERREEKIKTLLDSPSDPGVTFEESGIDYLIVDELHDYKNLETGSRINDAAIQGSKRSMDLLQKIEYLRDTHGGRVITGATATPIANSITEMYVMQRYLRPDLLADAGIHDFDSWAATFGKVTQGMEVSVAAGDDLRMKRRFAKFQNVPELLAMFHTFADVKTAEDLQLPTPDLVELEDGRRAPQILAIDASAEQREFVAQLGERMEAITKGYVDPRDDNVLKISTEGRKAALDFRLIDPEHVPETPPKVAVTADVVATAYHEHKDDVFLDPVTGANHPTLGALQLVFCDYGTPKTARAGEEAQFDVYNAMRDELIQRGVPGEKVRFIHEAKNSQQKAQLFEAARTGEIAVLMGSTSKMGVGTNVQDRVVHLVDMDAPWRPADLAQRHGRAIRQGNQNDEVRITVAITEGTFDAFMFQGVERKSRFIDQVMRGRLDVREIEDVGEVTLNYAEYKAVGSGNPLVLERSEVEQKVRKLQRLERAHDRDHTTWRGRREMAESRVGHLEEALPRLRAAAGRTLDTLGGDKFAMTVDGVEHTERAKAAEAIQVWARTHNQAMPPMAGHRDLGVMGSIAGHDIRVIAESANRVDVMQSQVTLQVEDAPGVAAIASRYRFQNPTHGLVQTIENQVAKIPQHIEKTETEIAEQKQKIEDANQVLDRPFERQAELQAARSDLARIDRQLAGGSDKDAPATGQTDVLDEAAEPSAGEPRETRAATDTLDHEAGPEATGDRDSGSQRHSGEPASHAAGEVSGSVPDQTPGAPRGGVAGERKSPRRPRPSSSPANGESRGSGWVDEATTMWTFDGGSDLGGPTPM